jgi:sugar phosphate isomerase/epimerase
MKPIALQLYSLREQAKKDFVGVLKAVAEMGYVAVEPAGLYGMKPVEVRKVLDDLELVCCSTHGGLPTRDTINARVDECAELGTDLIISGLGPKDFQTPEAIKVSLDRLTEAADLAAEAGMKFGYHNHWWEFDQVDGKVPYEIILGKVPKMFSQLDIYWAANFGTVDVPAVLRKHAKRVPLLHVKDGPLVKGAPHTAVGAGKMDVPAVVQAADEKVLKWLVVELDECATDMAEAVRASCRYLADEGLGRART